MAYDQVAVEGEEPGEGNGPDRRFETEGQEPNDGPAEEDRAKIRRSRDFCSLEPENKTI